MRSCLNPLSDIRGNHSTTNTSKHTSVQGHDNNKDNIPLHELPVRRKLHKIGPATPVQNFGNEANTP
jgi:hypothetical protein